MGSGERGKPAPHHTCVLRLVSFKKAHIVAEDLEVNSVKIPSVHLPLKVITCLQRSHSLIEDRCAWLTVETPGFYLCVSLLAG